MKESLNKQITPSHVPIDFEKIISEINNRKRRKNNIILFGAQESNVNNDTTFAKEVIQFVDKDISTSSIKIFRLGKETSNKIRPIKIVLNSNTDVQKLIRNARKLKSSDNFKTLYLTTDKTKRELRYLQQIK